MWFIHFLGLSLGLYRPPIYVLCLQGIARSHCDGLAVTPVWQKTALRPPPNLQINLQNFIINHPCVKEWRSLDWGVHLAHKAIHTGQYKADTWYLSNQFDHSNMPNQINQIIESDSNIWFTIIKGFRHQSQIITSLWVMQPWPRCHAQGDLLNGNTWGGTKQSEDHDCPHDDPSRDEQSE